MSKEKYLSPLEELDLVLKEINGVVSAVEHTHNQPSDAEVLYEYFKGQNKFISKINLNRILIKLEKDTYISKNENGEYSVTWEGRLFILDGGYIGEYDNRYAEKIRVDKIELSQKNFRYTQNVLLILVSVGTLVAAWYYLNEMNAHYYHWW